jgi:hypothetical protein
MAWTASFTYALNLSSVDILKVDHFVIGEEDPFADIPSVDDTTEDTTAELCCPFCKWGNEEAARVRGNINILTVTVGRGTSEINILQDRLLVKALTVPTKDAPPPYVRQCTS